MQRSTVRAVVAFVFVTLVAGCAGNGARVTKDESTAQAADKRFAKAFSLMQNEDFVRAESELARLAQATPQDAQVHTNLGIVYAKTGRFEEAVTALQTAIRLEPKASLAHNELGIVYRKTGDFAKAADAYREAIKQRPDFANAHYNLGVLLDLYLRQPSAALAHYESYLSLAGSDDKQVQAWVKDLQRRTSTGPTTASNDDEVERR